MSPELAPTVRRTVVPYDVCVPSPHPLPRYYKQKMQQQHTHRNYPPLHSTYIYIVYALLVTKEERKMVRILHRTAVKAILTVQRFQQHTLTLFHSSLHLSFKSGTQQEE